ncbi:MAG TPA: precorrin-2 C(20)-methyltransferase [Dissulfurispiraceae bacterium]|nr:precorrin-2 C(20)-methyltransferase [Dissulfurispiraceae bacterium]
MNGKLFVIGIGPGDPELLTLKAVRILERVPTICVPKGREEGTSLALSIVQQAVILDGTDIIEAHFPMRKTRDHSVGKQHPQGDAQMVQKWEATAREIISRLQQGTDVAFITLGDPSIYSTYFYLHDLLLQRLPGVIIDFVPGISSVTAAAARAGISLGLGDEKISILPATYAGDIRTVLAGFDTVVLMKVHSVFADILPVLKELHLEGNCVYVARAGMPDERIVLDVSSITAEDLDYFSILIIRTRRPHARA